MFLQRISIRQRLVLALFLMSCFCFALSVVRVVATGTLTYLFLNWNLILAALPWLASGTVASLDRLRTHRLATAFALIVWLLFFPNALYILTDLFHLRSIDNAPIWFDLVLILSFAWTGLVFGFASLKHIESLVGQYVAKPLVNVLVTVLLFGASFGIYLGRFLRWNSWDVVSQPFCLLDDIAVRVLNPLDHGRTWAVTLLLGMLLNMMYRTVSLLQNVGLNEPTPVDKHS